MDSDGLFQLAILVLNFKYFGAECHQLGAAGWHKCSFSRYLLSRLLNTISRYLCHKL